MDHGQLKIDKLALIQKYVVCPFCKSDIKINDISLTCKKCKRAFKIIENEIPSMLGDMSEKSSFSMEKWEKIYQTWNNSEEEYKRLYLDDVLRQILEYANESKDTAKVYLEIGCGPGFIGQKLAKRGWLFIGIDFSLKALISLKKRLDGHGIKNYLLIHGNIQSLPLRNNLVNLIYGGGVIEHFENPQIVINNIFNVLTENGVSFNEVSFLNIGNMLYRSRWGGIPHVPVMKPLAEFVHLRLLKGKHMVFGNEYQFTLGRLRKFHIDAGFKADNITVDRFACFIQLYPIRNRFLREFMRALCRKNRQFWPMVKVIGVKK